MKLFDFVVATFCCFVILLVKNIGAESPIEPCFFDDDDNAVVLPKEMIQFTLTIDSVTKRRKQCKGEAIEQLWDILEDRLLESGRKGGGGEDFGEKIRFTNVVQTFKKTKVLTRVIRWEGRAACPFCFQKEKYLRSNFLMLFQRRVTHRINGALQEITMDEEEEEETRMCLGSNFKVTFQIDGATVLAPLPGNKLEPPGITGVPKPGLPGPGKPKPPGIRKPKPPGIRKPKPDGPSRGITGVGSFSGNRSPYGGGGGSGGVVTGGPGLGINAPSGGGNNNGGFNLLGGSEFSITLRTINSNADIDKCSPSFKEEINKHIELGVKKYGEEYAKRRSDNLGSFDVNNELGRRLSFDRHHHRQLRRRYFVWTGWTACRWCNDDDSDGGGAITSSSLSPVQKLQSYISSKLTNDINQLAKDRTEAIQKMSCIGSGNYDIAVNIKFGTPKTGSSNRGGGASVGVTGVTSLGGISNGGFTSTGSGGRRPITATSKESGDGISTTSSGEFGNRGVAVPDTNVVDQPKQTYKLKFEIVFDVLGVDETCDAHTQGRINTVIRKTLTGYEQKYPDYLDLHYSSQGRRRRRLVETTSAMHRILYRFVWSGWSGCHLCNPDDNDGWPRGGPQRIDPGKNDDPPIVRIPSNNPTLPTKPTLPIQELAKVELDVSRGLTIVLNRFAAQETAILDGEASCMGLGNDNVLATFQFKIDSQVVTR